MFGIGPVLVRIPQHEGSWIAPRSAHRSGISRGLLEILANIDAVTCRTQCAHRRIWLGLVFRNEFARRLAPSREPPLLVLPPS